MFYTISDKISTLQKCFLNCSYDTLKQSTNITIPLVQNTFSIYTKCGHHPLIYIVMDRS